MDSFWLYRWFLCNLQTRTKNVFRNHNSILHRHHYNLNHSPYHLFHFHPPLLWRRYYSFHKNTFQCKQPRFYAHTHCLVSQVILPWQRLISMTASGAGGRFIPIGCKLLSPNRFHPWSVRFSKSTCERWGCDHTIEIKLENHSN